MAKRRGPVGPFFDELNIGEWFRFRADGEALVKSGHSAAANRGFKGHYWRASTKIAGKCPVVRMTEQEVAEHIAAQPPPGQGELHPSEVKQHGTGSTAPAFNPYKQSPPATARPSGDEGRFSPGRAATDRARRGRLSGGKAPGDAPR